MPVKSGKGSTTARFSGLASTSCAIAHDSILQTTQNVTITGRLAPR
jgi:hypothetical protein